MTTIACDGKTISSDGLATVGDTIVGRSAVKLHKMDDGSIIGFAGEVNKFYVFMDWFGSDEPFPQTLEEDIEVICFSKDGIAIFEAGRFIPAEAPAAIGSGMQHALTAMDMGADSEKAIQMAALRDIATGGVITTLTLD
jgi:ATP-dependent protease HslVU (ClpYQ) peptidase subunit